MGVGLTPSSALLPQGLDEVRILVTDDQPEMLELIDRALGDAYQCEFASSLEEAYEKLAREDFQLAICNLAADGHVGLELAQRDRPDHPDTATVVLVTGEDDPGAARARLCPRRLRLSGRAVSGRGSC